MLEAPVPEVPVAEVLELAGATARGVRTLAVEFQREGRGLEPRGTGLRVGAPLATGRLVPAGPDEEAGDRYRPRLVLDGAAIGFGHTLTGRVGGAGGVAVRVGVSCEEAAGEMITGGGLTNGAGVAFVVVDGMCPDRAGGGAVAGSEREGQIVPGLGTTDIERAYAPDGRRSVT